MLRFPGRRGEVRVTEEITAFANAMIFDGDRDPLLRLILNDETDEFIRCAAIEALTRLHAERTLPMETAEARLRDLHDRLLPREVPDMVWVGWQQAVSNGHSGDHAPLPGQPNKAVDPIRNVGQKVGRNDPCPCGSGKKYKKCHGA